MVYCGKPSRACHACRERNTRCDAKPEGCTQCKATRRQCPGYRVQIDLMFRDQSSSIIQRVQSREARKRNKAPKTMASDRIPMIEASGDAPRSYYLDLDRRQPLRPVHIQPSVEDCATCYFITNHVVGMRSTGSGYLDTLYSLYQSHRADKCLITSVTAASLASYGYYQKDDTLLKMSHRQYTEAIHLTSAALSSAEDVKKDSTLLSVLILGTYELINGETERSSKAWIEHINGSVALLKIRGPSQTKSAFGRQLLLEVTRNILITCLWRSVQVPEHVADWTRQTYRSLPNYGLVGGLYEAMIAVSGYKAFVQTSNDCSEIIDRALKIERPLAAICTDPPRDRGFQTFYTETASPDVVFEGRYDACDYVGWSNLFNGIRVMRILVHEGIQDGLTRAFDPNSSSAVREEQISRFERSAAICAQMRQDIMASVPQILGHVEKRGGQFVFTETPTTWPARSYALIFPLWTCARSDVSEEARAYCIRSLKSISSRMGIQQGFVMAKALDRTRSEPLHPERFDRTVRFKELLEQTSRSVNPVLDSTTD